MALAIAFDDVKTKQRTIKADPHRGTFGGGAITDFFATRSDPALPHAVYLQYAPGRVSEPHYHGVDQFQVLLEGKGKMGRHDLSGYCVHFTRAYTAYGPFISDAGTGMTCFNLHANTGLDSRAHHFPEEKDKLKQMRDRQPWQITAHAAFPALQPGADLMLQEIPGLKDERGLAGYTLSMGPNAKANAPDPSHGDGQYLAVVKGSVLHDNKELKAPALVYVYSKEGPYLVHAGPAGVEVLVLNFPRFQTRSKDKAKSVQASTGFKTWQCGLCSFVYDEAAGMPGEGILPGTSWQDVPETWSCPDCSASKSDFQMIEQEH